MNVAIELRAPLLAVASDDATELWSIVALLAVVGVGLAMLAVFAVKATRPDRELLAPLEVMGRRKWRRSDPVWQRRELDAVRPVDARPLTPAPAVPVPLEGFDEGPAAEGFDDLADLGVDHDLTELPGGVVYDADPTPPSGEVPVIVPVAADEAPLAELGIDWRPPAPEDLTVPAADLAPDAVPPAPEPPEFAPAPAGAAEAVLADDDPTNAIVPPDEPVELLGDDESVGAPDRDGAVELGDDPTNAIVPPDEPVELLGDDESVGAPDPDGAVELGDADGSHTAPDPDGAVERFPGAGAGDSPDPDGPGKLSGDARDRDDPIESRVGDDSPDEVAR